MSLVTTAVVHGTLLLHALPFAPTDPAVPTSPTTPAMGESVTVGLNGVNGTPSSSIVVLLAITVLSVAPSLLLMMTSFTKIFVVLAMTRNALGLQRRPAQPGARRPGAVPVAVHHGPGALAT